MERSDIVSGKRVKTKKCTTKINYGMWYVITGRSFIVL